MSVNSLNDNFEIVQLAKRLSVSNSSCFGKKTLNLTSSLRTYCNCSDNYNYILISLVRITIVLTPCNAKMHCEKLKMAGGIVY